MGRKTPPTKKSSSARNTSDVRSNNLLTRQTATEQELLKGLANLENVLSNQIDDLQHYQRQHCIACDGLRISPNETSDQVTKKAEKVLTGNLRFDPEEVNYQTDNCHRAGKTNIKDRTQSSAVVRFKTYSFRESVCLKKENATKDKKPAFPYKKKKEKSNICL